MHETQVLIDIPMPITTPRLILRPPQPGDGAAIHEAKIETRTELLRWMEWAKKDETVDDNEAMVRKAHASFILREDMMLFGFHRDTGELIVSTGLHRFNWSIGKFEIGYWVRKKFHNQGYATEAANSLTRFAFGALNARRVQIFHADGNDASGSVIQKLGFEKECIRRADHRLPDGNIVASHDYACFNIDALPDLEVTW